MDDAGCGQPETDKLRHQLGQSDARTGLEDAEVGENVRDRHQAHRAHKSQSQILYMAGIEGKERKANVIGE